MPRKAKTSSEEKEVLVTKKTKKVNVDTKIEKKKTKEVAKPKKSTKKVVKKEEIKKTTNTKTKKTTKTTKIKKEEKFLPEYYDLPYRYNETIVKILAQTPKKMFVYWDISDKDIKKYKKVFGENFFNETYPVLLIHNNQMDYTFEVVVNDFANCWYVDINDAKCDYTVNLGRKFKDIKNLLIDKHQLDDENINLKNDYLEITNSNSLEIPNDHILFEKIGKTVKYRNVKTFEETDKNIENIISESGNELNIYNIYDFYNQIYKNEIEENIFDINNPSSGNTLSKI